MLGLGFGILNLRLGGFAFWVGVSSLGFCGLKLGVQALGFHTSSNARKPQTLYPEAHKSTTTQGPSSSQSNKLEDS